MKNKRLIFIGVIVLIIIIGWLSTVFSTVKMDVSEESPYTELIGDELTTKVKVVIAKNPEIPINEKYPNVLEDGTNYTIGDLEIIEEIPIGSKFKIHAAEMRKGSVSGMTTAYIYGSIKVHNKEYLFGYHWGNYEWLYEEKPYWTFPKAFWQDKPLPKKYFFKAL